MQKLKINIRLMFVFYENNCCFFYLVPKSQIYLNKKLSSKSLISCFIFWSLNIKYSYSLWSKFEVEVCFDDRGSSINWTGFK